MLIISNFLTFLFWKHLCKEKFSLNLVIINELLNYRNLSFSINRESITFSLISLTTTNSLAFLLSLKPTKHTKALGLVYQLTSAWTSHGSPSHFLQVSPTTILSVSNLLNGLLPYVPHQHSSIPP